MLRGSGLTRRRFVGGLCAAGLAHGLRAGPAIAVPELRGRQFDLHLGYQPLNITGAPGVATAVNGSVPGPILRWREGDSVALRVTNHLDEDSSVHWHGMILPTAMDGVPGLSFAGIPPGGHYDYRFDVRQSGTYWYHSHSGFQEQTGLYGAIVIEPRDGERHPVERDYVVLLSDWTDDDPAALYARLKKMSHYYNYRERTVGDLWRDIRDKGLADTWDDRAMWNQMRMSNTDIADINGYAYTYLMNGVPPAQGWRALFSPGERVRLRFVNGSAMSIFDIRIPGLAMRVVAADGQDIEPVTVDEFRIGTAETYDVIVEPVADSPYAIFAQSIDRSGYTVGHLTPHISLSADIPAMDVPPTLGHADMGMGHAMGHSGMDHAAMGHSAATSDGAAPGGAAAEHAGHGGEAHARHRGPAPPGGGSQAAIEHSATEYGPQVDMRAEQPASGMADPGVGLRHHQHRYGRRVLNYSDLRNVEATADGRHPAREIQLHLTGNMSRYMWSFDGVPYAEAEPILLAHGERVRFFLVNDTMMTHPIHLHGLWSELETGDGQALPRKHTVLVQPGATASYLVTADAPGRWAYHCHLQFHMAGMMREVRVQ